MGGFDRARLERRLIELGWSLTVDDKLIPPDSLWKNKKQSFHVYDADDLQNLLGEMSEDLKKALGE